MRTDLRCSELSEVLGEPLAGTAASDERWLFVEQPGPWARTVDLVVAGFEGHRVQLIRGVGRTQAVSGSTDTRRAFEVDLSEPSWVRLTTTTFTDTAELATADWQPYDAPLWLVCTNGRRDECCATRGRPVAAALAERWPDDTWETTHLSGHRFAPTLLALPSGYLLGRVAPEAAVEAAERLLAGDLPLELLRGRAGQPAQVQTAELHVRIDRDLRRVAEVSLTAHDGDEVTLETPDGPATVRVEEVTDEPPRTSCADVTGKSVPRYVARYSATAWGTGTP